MKDELEQQIEEAESSDDVIQGIKYTMRMRATLIVSSTLFEMLILMLIILNGVLLGVQTYEKFGPVTNQALDVTQRVRTRSTGRGRACVQPNDEDKAPSSSLPESTFFSEETHLMAAESTRASVRSRLSAASAALVRARARRFA